VRPGPPVTADRRAPLVIHLSRSKGPPAHRVRFEATVFPGWMYRVATSSRESLNKVAGPRVPRGLKSPYICANCCTTKQTAEEVQPSFIAGKRAPAGAEARHILWPLSARLKSHPDTKPVRDEFSILKLLRFPPIKKLSAPCAGDPTRNRAEEWKQWRWMN
jgi:hypothetical protein